jgi:DNA/RNA-binding domain of Phe-tRNA-synthetase-like protein
VRIAVEPHPSLDARAFIARFAQPLGELALPWLIELLSLGADAPLRPEEAARTAVRDLLRHGGYKPTGRGKPASEYLLRTANQGALPTINVAVDACNAVSLHSGLPISVVDLDRASEPFKIGLAGPGAEYVFNSAGQVMDIEGLVCLHDASGPCANPVKDSQRTKTSPATRNTLTVLWGCRAISARTDTALEWYWLLLERAGATVEHVALG